MAVTADCITMDELNDCGSGSDTGMNMAEMVDDDNDAGSVSDSPELTRVGCKIRSKAECPIAARRCALSQSLEEPAAKKPRSTSSQAGQAPVRVGWGTFVTRKMYFPEYVPIMNKLD